jgi:hypothetical protein
MKIKQPHGRKPLRHKTKKKFVEGLHVINGNIITLMNKSSMLGDVSLKKTPRRIFQLL